MLPILLALAFIAILLFIVTAGQPGEFVVSRSAKISAPPDKIFPRVNDLHKWENWSPWAKLDPNAKNSFSGADFGASAVMEWDGNKKIGAGKMTIIESRANELIRLKLEFIRPFQATNSVEFLLKQIGGQTEVVWTMSGKNKLFGKIFNLFVNCENMCGKDFEKGLASLRAVTEQNY